LPQYALDFGNLAILSQLWWSADAVRITVCFTCLQLPIRLCFLDMWAAMIAAGSQVILLLALSSHFPNLSANSIIGGLSVSICSCRYL